MSLLVAISHKLLRAGARLYLEDINMSEEVKDQQVEAKPENKFGKQKTVVITDKNGKDWTYKLQYPGMRAAMEILDNSRMPNGLIARSVFADQLLEQVVVEPAGLDVDSFDERPGLSQLIDEADLFLGEFDD